MPRVNTKDRIMEAALELFLTLGYQKTSIARIETDAGLVPRAGAFYRHFDSKQTLLFEIAKTFVSETPEGFGFERLSDYGDTRSELIAIALKYEEAMVRQKPFLRVIEEVRLLDVGADLQEEIDTDMMVALVAWTKGKPAAKGLSEEQISALVISAFGGWLFYLSIVKRGADMGAFRDAMLNEWATLWASVLDTAR